MHLFIAIFTNIESMLQHIIHLPLQLVFEITELPSFLLDALDLLAPLKLVGS
jgi:hypothetical protein